MKRFSHQKSKIDIANELKSTKTMLKKSINNINHKKGLKVHESYDAKPLDDITDTSATAKAEEQTQKIGAFGSNHPKANLESNVSSAVIQSNKPGVVNEVIIETKINPPPLTEEQKNMLKVNTISLAPATKKKDSKDFELHPKGEIINPNKPLTIEQVTEENLINAVNNDETRPATSALAVVEHFISDSITPFDENPKNIFTKIDNKLTHYKKVLKHRERFCQNHWCELSTAIVVVIVVIFLAFVIQLFSGAIRICYIGKPENNSNSNDEVHISLNIPTNNQNNAINQESDNTKIPTLRTSQVTEYLSNNTPSDDIPPKELEGDVF